MLKTWFNIAYGFHDKIERIKKFELRKQVYDEFKDQLYLFWQLPSSRIKKRWERLIVGLKKSEPHNPLNFKVALQRTKKYM